MRIMNKKYQLIQTVKIILYKTNIFFIIYIIQDIIYKIIFFSIIIIYNYMLNIKRVKRQ